MIRIRLVPITVGGRTVELNSQLVRQFKDYMIGMYPNHDMDVEVRSSLILPSSNSPNISDPNSWDVALDEFDSFRSDEISENERDIFYYGVLKSMSDEEWALGNGGTLGLGYVNDNFPNTDNLSSIGLRFDDVFLETVAHEIGHNHGRPHVDNAGEFNDNCQTPGSPDADYPYAFVRIQKNGL